MTISKVFFIVSFIAINLTGILAQSDFWTEDSFEDFIDGAFLDAGSNLYVSAKGRVQMITRWDLNGDGHLDIVLFPGHGHTEKEATVIYFNNGQDIDARSRIDIPGGGARDGALVDLNKDSWNDLIVVNYHDSHYGRVDTWVYYGGSGGYFADRRTRLPAYEGTDLAVGDYNGDGWLDLAIACQWQAGDAQPDGPRTSFIYWNSEDGFNRDHRLSLTFNEKGAHNMASGDLDGDNIDDLIAMADSKLHVFYSTMGAFDDPDKRKTHNIDGNAVAIGDVNGDGIMDAAVCVSEGVAVILGYEIGLDAEQRILIDVNTPQDVVVADVDGDNLDDVIAAVFSASNGATWTDSFVFYSDGRDFSSREPCALPTLGAHGVSAGDLNGDGLPELVFANERVINQNDLVSYVFWNKNGRFFFGNHTQLPTRGPMSNAIGDVNHDGLPDVVFFNDFGLFQDGAATGHIYWGDGTRNFSKERSTAFQGHPTFGLGHADLDDDGNVDLILARSGFIGGVNHGQNGLIIHWNNNGLFDRPTHLTMQTAYGGVRVADINRDGYLDILAGGHVVDLENPDTHGFPIFWGSEKGFSYANCTVLHMEPPRIRGQLLMDLNKDGWLDIAGQLEFGSVRFWWGGPDGFSDNHFSDLDLERNDHLMYLKAADVNNDGWLDLLLPLRGPPEGTEGTSFLYYGSEIGFSNERRIELSCFVTYQNTIADFDNDGWLDIFLCAYGGEVAGNRPSLIHWGSPKGFFDRPRSELETYGSSGSEALDYDGDGWLDLLISNHRQSGSYDIPQPHRHVCNSMLYWGGPDGFSSESRWEVEVVGPSGLNLRDAGNSYDRELYEDYISSSFQVPEGKNPVKILWKAETPHGTSVRFQIRTANSESALQSSQWTGPKGPQSWFDKSGSKIRERRGGYIQYRARLETPNGAATPYLTLVTVEFK